MGPGTAHTSQSLSTARITAAHKGRTGNQVHQTPARLLEPQAAGPASLRCPLAPGAPPACSALGTLLCWAVSPYFAQAGGTAFSAG